MAQERASWSTWKIYGLKILKPLKGFQLVGVQYEELHTKKKRRERKRFFFPSVFRVASQVTERLEEGKNSATLQPKHASLQVLSSELHLLTQIWLLHPLRCFHLV